MLLFGCNSKKTRLNFLNNLYGYNRSDNVFYYNGATFSSVHFRYSQHLLYTSILLMTKQKTRRTWLQDNFWVTIPGFLSLDSLNFSHRLLNKRDLTTRRLSHDGAVGSPYSIAPSSCRNLNLRFAVKTTTFLRDRQIFSPFLKFIFIFWEGELLKPNCLTSDKRELVSHTFMETTL